MTTTIELPEELRALIGEVARDPRSRLFRFTPPTCVTAPLIGRESLSARSAGWTLAERHLLATYREELAQALARVFHYLSLSRPGIKDMLEGGRNCGPESLGRLERLCGSSLSRRLEPDLGKELAALVEQLLGEWDQPLNRITAFGVTLLNDHRAANRHGYALLLDGEPGKAIEVLQKVYKDASRAHVRVYAAMNVAHGNSFVGTPAEECLDSFLLAVREDAGLLPLAPALVLAGVVGRLSIVADLGQRLNDAALYQVQLANEIVRVYEAQSFSSVEVAALRSVQDRVEGVAARVIQAAMATGGHCGSDAQSES